MNDSIQLGKLERLIVRNPKLLFTFGSYLLVLLMYINSVVIQSSILGLGASVLYILINGAFLGHVFFDKEPSFFRMMLGVLLFFMLLGFVSWLAVIIYNLDVLNSALALFAATTFCSLLNGKVKR